VSSDRRSRWTRRALALALGLVVALGLVEVGARLLVLAASHWATAPRSVAFTEDGQVRILCLGDSMTAGMYPRHLQRYLDRERPGVDFLVVDKGLSGSITSEVMALLPEALATFDPAIVVTMLGFNDGRAVLPFAAAPVEDRPLLRSLRLARMALAQHRQRRAVHAAMLPPAGAVAPEEFVRLEVAYKQELVRVRERTYSRFCESERGEVDRLLEQAWQIHPHSWEVALALGRCMRDRGDSEDALEMFDIAIGLAPGQYWGHIDKGTLLVRLGRYREGIEELERAIAIDPTMEKSYEALAQALQATGQPARASEALERKARVAATLEHHQSALDPITTPQYRALRDTVLAQGRGLVAVQYPTMELAPLRQMLEEDPRVVVVDNEQAFLETIATHGFGEVFFDSYGISFGHTTDLGSALMAERIGAAILERWYPSSQRGPEAPLPEAAR
jgi:tetratricopeptide (TPR) repeat protein